MRLLIGDDVGQAKIIETSAGIDTTLQKSARATTTSFFPPSRTRPIQFSTVVAFQSTPSLAAVFSRGGHLRIFDPLSSAQSPDILFSHTLPVTPETPAIGLGLYNSSTYLYAATPEHLFTLSLVTGEHNTQKLPHAVSVLTAYSPDDATEAHPAVIATAAEGKDVELFAGADLKSLWKAKNVKPNALKLAQPIWPTQIIFLPSNTEGWRFVVGTKAGLVRIYDSAVSRRPVWAQQVCKDRIVALQLHPDSEIPEAGEGLFNAEDLRAGVAAEKMRFTREMSVVVADYSGGLEAYSLDLRRSVGLYKGLSGAVMGVEVKAGVVAAVGLGRYVGVWDASTRKLLSRVYVKTQGGAVAVLEAEDEVVEEEEKSTEKEDVWEGMEEVTEEPVQGDVADKLLRIRVKKRKDIAKFNGEEKRQKV